MCALPNMSVFCNSLISCFPGILLRCFLSDFEMAQFAPLTTGITFAFTFHMRWISIMGSLYFKIFRDSFSITLLLLLLLLFMVQRTLALAYSVKVCSSSLQSTVFFPPPDRNGSSQTDCQQITNWRTLQERRHLIDEIFALNVFLVLNLVCLPRSLLHVSK